MAKRGRPKKLIKEVENIINEELKDDLNELKIVDKIIEEKTSDIVWDVPINQKIEYFDPNLSYELTKYRPITETLGLDFNPEWFLLVKRIKQETGKYCTFPLGTKSYRDFWDLEYERCNKGMEVNGYRITGDNYFFLNYYQLQTTKVEKAGLGREMVFPEFLSKQYEYFHYVEMALILGLDVCSVKSRASGWSEIHASIGVNAYTTRRSIHCVYTAFAGLQLDPTLRKVWYLLDNLNANSEGGMRHVRLKYNDSYHKKASKVNKLREELPDSWGSDILGIIADNSRKLRGDRIDLLFFEEAGSNPILKETYIKGRALIEVMGRRIGTRFTYGTGGDSKCMSELADIFNNPKGFQVLPYKHNYTKSKEYIYSGFFVPSYTILTYDKINGESVIDSRGVTNTEKAIKYYEKEFELLIQSPKDLLKDKAEFCFTPEDAFSFEGDNLFNIILLSELLSKIKLFKEGPHVDCGTLEYNFRNNHHIEEAVEGVRFVPKVDGPVKIIEHPIRSNNNVVPSNLYVAGIDGIDIGLEDTSESTVDPSNFCVVIKKRTYGLLEPLIVAYYKDRPQKLREAHLSCLKLLLYYNCKAVVESTRLSILLFFREKRCEDRYLMRRPRATQTDIQLGKSRLFGAPATEVVIRHQLDLIAQYIDEFCHNIWFVEVLEEAIKYSYLNKRKFDIIAAWGMAELGDEELRGIVPIERDNPKNKLRTFGYWVDENGVRHKGVIPNNIKPQVRYNPINENNYDDSIRIRTSDPRFNT